MHDFQIDRRKELSISTSRFVSLQLPFGCAREAFVIEPRSFHETCENLRHDSIACCSLCTHSLAGAGNLSTIDSLSSQGSMDRKAPELAP
jgi:hypothetical protein